MTVLTIATVLHDSHDDVLRGHEWEFLRDSSSNDHWIDDETFGDILKDDEKGVRREVSLWEGDSAVGTDGYK